MIYGSQKISKVKVDSSDIVLKKKNIVITFNIVMVLWQCHWKHYSYDNVVRVREAMKTTVTYNIQLLHLRLLLFGMLTYNQRQNCWDLVLKWGNVCEQNNPHPSSSSPPPPLYSKVGCLSFSTGCFTEQQHENILRREGRGRKALFSPF